MSDISDGSIDGEAADDGERSLTLERQTKLLLGELPHLDAYDVARMVGTSAARVLQFWRALGFPGVPASSKVFTRADADGLRAALDLIESSGLSETAWRALVRAAAHSADRLALHRHRIARRRRARARFPRRADRRTEPARRSL